MITQMTLFGDSLSMYQVKTSRRYTVRNTSRILAIIESFGIVLIRFAGLILGKEYSDARERLAVSNC